MASFPPPACRHPTSRADRRRFGPRTRPHRRSIPSVTLPFDVEGPVRAEVFVVAMVDGGIHLTGPDGPQPWHVQTHGRGHPMDEVRGIVGALLDEVTLFHSTSWRWDHGSVVLTFLAVIPSPGDMPAVPVDRSDLARSEATRAPAMIGWSQVLEHALRHLAWLAREDDVVGGTLDDAWHGALAGYVPAPFEQLQREEAT